MDDESIKSLTHVNENDELDSKQSKSDVWDAFEKLSTTNREDPKAHCKFCKKIYTCKSSGGTSHLRRHISKCPKRAFRDIKQYTI